MMSETKDLVTHPHSVELSKLSYTLSVKLRANLEIIVHLLEDQNPYDRSV